MTSQTQLPIIDEEAQREAAATAAVDEEEDQEEESATLAQVVRRRGTSKATHTRQRNAVTAAIQGRVDREEIIAERRVLVRDYDNVLNHHNRVVKLTPTGEDEKEKQWLAVVTQLHRDSLQEIDTYVALFPPPGYSRSHPPSSVHSSRSTRSVAFKLLDTQREVQEAELRLKQAEREADIRREEEAKKLEIDLAREQRRRTDELLERQAAESLESVDLRQDPAAEQSRPSGVDPFHQPPFHVTNQLASSLVGTPVQPPASSSGARSTTSKGIFSRVRGLFTPIRNSQSRAVANGSAVDGLGVSGARSGRLGVSGARSVSLGVFGAQTASTASVSGLANGLGVFGARAESQATTKSNPIAQNDLGVLGAQVAPPGATTAAASSHSVGQMVPLASSSQLLSGLPALVGVCSKVPTSVHHSRQAVSIAASWASDPVSSAPFVSMAPLREIAGVTTSISLPLTSIYAPAAPATSTAFIHPGGPPASSSVGHRYPSPSSAAYTSPVLPASVGYTSAPYFVPPLDPTAAAFAAGVCGARPEGTAVGVSPSDSWPRGTYGVRPPELNSPDGWIDDLDLHRRSAS